MLGCLFKHIVNFFQCLLPGPDMLTNCHPITTNFNFFVFVGMTTCREL